MMTWGGWLKSMGTFPQRIFLIALILRLIPVLWGRDLGIGLDDMFQYDMLARSIVTGEGYRWYAQDDLHLASRYVEFDLTNYDPRGVVTAFRPPLYPLFLAVIYFFSGIGPERFLVARLVQVILGALLVPLTYCLARRLIPQNERAARWSAWVVACYPMLVLYPLSLATENLFFVLVLGTVLLLLKIGEQPTWRNFILAGILLGLAALTRSVVLVMVGAGVLWIWCVLKEKRGAVIVAATVALVIAPWVVRNAIVFHRPTIEMSLGYNLYVGYHPDSTGTIQYGISLDLMPILSDAERDRVGVEKALGYIQADPARVPYLALRRLGHFFGLERRALTFFYANDFFGFIPFPILFASALIFLLPFVVLGTSAAAGLAIRPWQREVVLIILLMSAYLLPHMFILAEDRFHLTLIPFMAIFAAQCWTGGWQAIYERWSTRTGRIAIILATVLILLLFVVWGTELYRDADKLMVLFGPNGNRAYFGY